MIIGIGIDVITVARIARIWDRHRERFAQHVLAPGERDELHSVVGDPARWIAKRWAAKEAFAKAAGTGMRAPIKWNGISVVHDELGRPELEFAPFIHAWLHRREVQRWHLSLSDERDLVCAVVILEAPEQKHVAA
jgi:holo-[acyl-carrier protein] synthase